MTLVIFQTYHLHLSATSVIEGVNEINSIAIAVMVSYYQMVQIHRQFLW